MITHINGVHIALPTWHKTYPSAALKMAEKQIAEWGKDMNLEFLFQADGIRGAYLQIWDDDISHDEAYELAERTEELLIGLNIFREDDVTAYHLLSVQLERQRREDRGEEQP